MPYRFLIIDEHAVVIDGWGVALNVIAPGCKIVGVNSIEQARVALDSSVAPDLVLFDCDIANGQMQDLIFKIQDKKTSTLIAMYSSEPNVEVILNYLRMGCAGYIVTKPSIQHSASSLQTILNGDFVVPSYLVPRLLDREEKSGATVQSASTTMPEIFNNVGLSKREFAALTLLATGISNKSIAKDMNIAESTVKVHVSAIFRALGVKSRAQAIIAAHRKLSAPE